MIQGRGLDQFEVLIVKLDAHMGIETGSCRDKRAIGFVRPEVDIVYDGQDIRKQFNIVHNFIIQKIYKYIINSLSLEY